MHPGPVGADAVFEHLAGHPGVSVVWRRAKSHGAGAFATSYSEAMPKTLSQPGHTTRPNKRLRLRASVGCAYGSASSCSIVPTPVARLPWPAAGGSGGHPPGPSPGSRSGSRVADRDRHGCAAVRAGDGVEGVGEVVQSLEPQGLENEGEYRPLQAEVGSAALAGCQSRGGQVPQPCEGRLLAGHLFVGTMMVPEQTARDGACEVEHPVSGGGVLGDVRELRQRGSARREDRPLMAQAPPETVDRVLITIGCPFQ